MRNSIDQISDYNDKQNLDFVKKICSVYDLSEEKNSSYFHQIYGIVLDYMFSNPFALNYLKDGKILEIKNEIFYEVHNALFAKFELDSKAFFWFRNMLRWFESDYNRKVFQQNQGFYWLFSILRNNAELLEDNQVIKHIHYIFEALIISTK
jgi:hypothetical protein